MKPIKLFLILCFCLPATVFAQYAVRGKILDGTSLQAVDFANVSVLSTKDNSVIGGAITQTDGSFEILNLKKGNYIIVFSFMGYQEQRRDLTVQNASINIGKIYLQEDTQTLQEVEIVGQGSSVRFELDRKVFSVDQNIANAGGSVTDVLENLPSVEVDQDGNVSLRNSDGVEIWINGKPSGLSAENRAQILQQMPAGNIKEIEVITNPGAKFSPEGTAGIINLVMKKDRKAGYYGSVTAGIEYGLAEPWNVPPGANVGFNINMNKGRVDAFFNAGYRYRTSNGGTTADRYDIDGMGSENINDIPDSLLQKNLVSTTQNDRRGGGLFLRAGMDIRLSEYSTIGVSGFGIVEESSALRMFDDNLTTYLQTDCQTGDTLREYERRQTGGGWHPGGNAMIDYRFQFDKHKLSVSAAYFDFQFNQENTYTQTDNNSISAQEQLTYNHDQSIEIKADYEWKPTQQSRLEAGYQANIAWRQTEASAFNGTDRLDEIFAYYNDFSNSEQTHALYITYGNRFFDRLSLQTGLRAEFFQRHLDSYYKDAMGNMQDVYSLKPDKQDTSYFQVYPSIFLGYDFGGGNELQLNYTRRVDRPRGHQINPRQNFSDSTNISNGNSELLPSYSSNLELNYLKTWERHTISAGIFWRYKENIVQNVSYRDDAIMRNTYINAATRHEAGLEVAAKNRLFGEILQLNASVNLYYNKIGSSHFENYINGQFVSIELPEQSTISWSARLTASFLFTKSFSGQVSANYRSPRVLAQGKTDHNYNIDFGLRKTFLDKQLALSFNVRDILNSRARRSTTWGEGFYQFSTRRWHSRNISLTITYNFGNTQQRKSKPAAVGGMNSEDYGED